MFKHVLDVIPSAKVDAAFNDLKKAGEISITADFANIAQNATPKAFVPELNAGLTQNNGVQEVSDFIAPAAPKTLDAYMAYNYRYYPTANAIPTAQDAKKYERGLGGEFQFVGAKSELKSATMKNFGLSMLLEKRLGDTDPTYRNRMFAYLASLLSTVELSLKIDALDAITTPATTTWKPADGDLNLVLEDKLTQAGDEVGIDFNRILFGKKAWSIYHSNLGAGNNAMNFAYFMEDAKKMGNRLDVDVLQPAARMRNSAGAFPRFAAANIYGFLARGSGENGLSNLLTFNDGRGVEMNTFDHPQKQLEIITVSKWFDVAVTVPNGAFKIQVSAS